MDKTTQSTARRTKKTRRIGPFTRERWVHWSEVARYMDAQPERCITAPFPDDPPISYRLLSNMAQFSLVRHRNSDCRWQLSPRWQSILARLAQGLPAEERDKTQAAVIEGTPFVVDFGVDTLYVNILAEEAPLPFLEALATLKGRAQVDYKSVETPWLFGGSVLSLLPNGKGTGQTGGVSWGYILRNDLVEIRLRKKPMSGIVAAVHFLAECLWLNGAKPSLDLMTKAFRRMWSDPDAFADVHYQLSQIHLCADIAHFPLTDAYLPHLVTHSIKRTVHLPSHADLALDDSLYDEHTSVSDDDDWLFNGMPPQDWYDADPDLPDDAYADDDDGEDDQDEDEGDQEEEEDTTQWHPEGAKVHWRGKAMEGIGFSPAGDLSAAWYDKILEERKVKKTWMREIHKAGGWELGMLLTRIELRYRRGILNELEVAFGTEKGARWFDDPYVALDHLGEMWGFGVGYPPEYDHLPDVTHRGWMRLAVPDPNDGTRSRWATDPLWEVVQRVPFAQGLPKPLKRAKEAKPDLDKIDAEIRGLLVSRAMLRGSYLKAPAEISQELEAFDERIAEWDSARGRNFAEDVRERARMAGKKLPYKPSLVFPRDMERLKRRNCF
ncbi:MAG: hypothetical protein H0U76_09620 [Ktedonobacteraceae bacterium]|nr:hypothetical protein [Ktedonobacteraceae bacterium]MBA3826088.1 hypothetical protein [Ktedonobacterales bacterium]